MIATRAKTADPTSKSERCRRIVRTRFALGTSGSVGSARGRSVSALTTLIDIAVRHGRTIGPAHTFITSGGHSTANSLERVFDIFLMAFVGPKGRAGLRLYRESERTVAGQCTRARRVRPSAHFGGGVVQPL